MARYWLSTVMLLMSAVSLPAEGNMDVYIRRCAACHGRDGGAQTPQGRKLKARDLRASRLTDAEIERQIREGSKVKTGVAVMPPFAGELSDAEIQSAIRAVKSFRSTMSGPESAKK